MRKHYTQLDISDREELYAYIQKGYGVKDISEMLNCHRSTIYRELKRNKTRIGYLPDSAQSLADKRRVKTLKIDRNPVLRKLLYPD